MTTKTSFFSRILNAKNFIKDVQDSNNRYYLAVGKADAWSTSATDFVDNLTLPELVSGPYRNQAYERQIRTNFLSMKKIPSNQVSHMIKKWVWGADNGNYGNYFVAWDSTVEDIHTLPFYMFDGTSNVYKCLKAGPSFASIRPNHTTSAPVTGSDGYTWRYMYSLSAEQVPFITKEFLPVRTIAYDENLSGVELIQYNNQQASLADKGKIYYIKVTAGGTGYTSTPTVTITGDGTGATATAVVTNGVLVGINVTNNGANYNFASVTISGGGGTGATAVAVLPPKNGHGFDPVAELFGNYVMMYVNVEQDEDGKFIVNNDFRQVSLLRNPTQFGSTSALTAEVASAIKVIDVAVAVPARIDNLVIGVTSGAKAFVATVNESAGAIGIKQNDKTGYGSFQNGEVINFYNDNSSTVIATTTITSVTASPASNPDVDSFSGEIIITENKVATTRTDQSSELYRMMVQY